MGQLETKAIHNREPTKFKKQAAQSGKRDMPCTYYNPKKTKERKTKPNWIVQNWTLEQNAYDKVKLKRKKKCCFPRQYYYLERKENVAPTYLLQVWFFLLSLFHWYDKTSKERERRFNCGCWRVSVTTASSEPQSLKKRSFSIKAKSTFLPLISRFIFQIYPLFLHSYPNKEKEIVHRINPLGLFLIWIIFLMLWLI